MEKIKTWVKENPKKATVAAIAVVIIIAAIIGG